MTLIHLSQCRRSTLLWITLFYLLILTTQADTGCFNPNGTNRNVGAPDVPTGTSVYFPCNTVQPYSMCCRNSDKCLANGLCQQEGSDIIWRESCSDQTWRSDACVKLCVSETGMFCSLFDDLTRSTNSHIYKAPQRHEADRLLFHLTGSDMQVLQCPDQSYCCAGGSNNATQCCEQGHGNWILDNGLVTNVNPNATSTTSSSSVTKTPAPTHSSSSSSSTPPNPTGAQATTQPSSSKSSSNNNIGAIVGGIVGGLVLLAIALSAILFLLRRARRRREIAQMQPQIPPMAAMTYQETPPAMVPYQYQMGMDMKKVSEVPGDGLRTEELDGQERSELGGSGIEPGVGGKR